MSRLLPLLVLFVAVVPPASASTVGVKTSSRWIQARTRPRRDTTPPTAQMTAPVDGATVSGTVAVSATASDNVAVDHVTFRVDGVAVASDYSAPYGFPWDSIRVADGSHTISVRAVDTSGNTSVLPDSATAVTVANNAPPPPPPPPSACPAITAWVAPQVQQTSSSYLYTPMSDADAAACVVHANESVPGNAAANAYVPMDTELSAFHAGDNGVTPDGDWWYPQYVTGRPGLANPSTDDLIQWASYKWGIPADWLRAQAMQESDWNQQALGDLRTEVQGAWTAYHDINPIYCPNSTQCYESVGLMQIKWQPFTSEGAGTEPLRLKSTAFNLDYTASTERMYFDNPNGLRASWGDSSYAPLDVLAGGGNGGCFSLSLAAHFSPYPWGNSGQLSYCADVQAHLTARDWP